MKNTDVKGSDGPQAKTHWGMSRRDYRAQFLVNQEAIWGCQGHRVGKALGLAPSQPRYRARIDFGIYIPGLCSHTTPISRIFLLPFPSLFASLSHEKQENTWYFLKRSLPYQWDWIHNPIPLSPIKGPYNSLNFFPLYYLIRMGEVP